MPQPSTFQIVWAACLVVWAVALVGWGVALLRIRAKRRSR